MPPYVRYMPMREVICEASPNPEARRTAARMRVVLMPFRAVRTPDMRPPRQNMIIEMEKVSDVPLLDQPNSCSSGTRNTDQA